MMTFRDTHHQDPKCKREFKNDDGSENSVGARYIKELCQEKLLN